MGLFKVRTGGVSTTVSWLLNVAKKNDVYEPEEWKTEVIYENWRS